MNAQMTASLSEQLDTLLGTPNLYIAIGCIFLCIMIYTLFLLFRKPSATASCEDLPANPFDDTDSDVISQNILGLNGKPKSVLLAGAGLDSLPVTIPVKAAIHLAQQGRRILLIDLDTRRNAAAKVFELNTSATFKQHRPSPVPTVIQNLSVWPADYFARFTQINLRELLRYFPSRYDIAIINAPYLDSHPDRKLIASCSEYGFIFCRKPLQFQRLTQLLTDNGCRLIQKKPACP